MKNVLVVDDNEVFIFLSKKLLEFIGLTNQIYTARHGKEALDVINRLCNDDQHIPHVVLLDLNMPVMDGYTFLLEFQKLSFPNKSQIRIIVLTSSKNQKDIDRAMQLGADAYLGKPLEEELIRTFLLEH